MDYNLAKQIGALETKMEEIAEIGERVKEEGAAQLVIRFEEKTEVGQDMRTRRTMELFPQFSNAPNYEDYDIKIDDEMTYRVLSMIWEQYEKERQKLIKRLEESL